MLSSGLKNTVHEDSASRFEVFESCLKMIQVDSVLKLVFWGVCIQSNTVLYVQDEIFPFYLYNIYIWTGNRRQNPDMLTPEI